MLRLPRVALGSIQPDISTQPVCWALMDAFRRRGRQIQHFVSRSCFCQRSGALAITGVNSRHLDTWLMSRSMCREIFVHGCAGRDLAVIEGRFPGPDGLPASSSLPASPCGASSLDTICDWLDVPRLIVLDASRIDGCQLPERPAQIDGLLLDRVSSLSEAFRLQTSLESLWDVPVLAALGEVPKLRAAIGRLPCGAVPTLELCRELGNEFERFSRFELIESLAARRDMPSVRSAIFETATSRSAQRRVTIAVAYDPAFNCYFPDSLELLEMRGASVVDFSPLRDEVLPDADIVYFGCGHPELYADALSRNHCMLLALRNHIRAGRRVYAEGGGLAYLCERLETSEGALVPMVGALPAVARLNRQMAPPAPVEAMLAANTWLAPAGTRLRGYVSGHWLLEPTGPLIRCLSGADRSLDLVGQYNVLGSRMHLNFAAQPNLLQGFFKPRAAAFAGSAAGG